METIFFLRLFAETDSETVAIKIFEKVVSLIENFVDIESRNVQRYWKNEKYFEIFFKLKSKVVAFDAFHGITEVFASKWEKINQDEAIWSPEISSKFIIQEVRWAHLEIEERCSEL